jgi:VWFA-related protein
MRHASLSVFPSLLAAVLLSPASSPGAAAPQVPVIRISAELVQLDVVVTDKAGRHVIDLRPEDFEVREDGRLQKVAHLTYVGVDGRRDGPALDAETAGVAWPPRRTVAIVVDDLSLSISSVDGVRRALGRLVDGLAPADRIAIVTTAGGGDGLRFTSERAELHEAAAHLHYRAWSRAAGASFASLNAPFPFGTRNGLMQMEGDLLSWDERLALRSLGVVRDIVDSLKDVPGRKALVVVSEGFSVWDRRARGWWPMDRVYGDSDDVPGALRRLGDIAARSAVVVHALDPRGPVVTGFSAHDASPRDLPGQRLDRLQSQASLRLLPDETGGITVTDTNDLASGFESIVADLAGYYLIGYEPGDSTFAGPKGQPSFHKISVKVKARGLTARTRKGFYGVTDEALTASR